MAEENEVERRTLMVRPDVRAFFISLDNTQKAFIARVLLLFPDVWPALEHEAAEWWNELGIRERVPLVDKLNARFYEQKEVGPDDNSGTDGQGQGDSRDERPASDP